MASDFGSGLGGIIGGAMASSDLSDARGDVNSNVQGVQNQLQPYQNFGVGMLNPTTTAINQASTFASGTQGYQDFMKNYQTSPAAQYQLQQGEQSVNNSAAARGGLLSGANLRALDTMSQGISNQFANQAYNEYLQGNTQQFGQLESILGNLYQGIGVGQTATGQNTQLVTGQNQATASLAAAQAKADAGIGSGIGSLFSGLAGIGKSA